MQPHLGVATYHYIKVCFSIRAATLLESPTTINGEKLSRLEGAFAVN